MYKKEDEILDLIFFNYDVVKPLFYIIQGLKIFIGYLEASDRNIKIEYQRNIIKKYASDSSIDIDVFMSGNDVASISFDDNSNSHTIVLSNM